MQHLHRLYRQSEIKIMHDHIDIMRFNRTTFNDTKIDILSETTKHSNIRIYYIHINTCIVCVCVCMYVYIYIYTHIKKHDDNNI